MLGQRRILWPALGHYRADMSHFARYLYLVTLAFW